jgi:hypothetical protein
MKNYQSFVDPHWFQKGSGSTILPVWIRIQRAKSVRNHADPEPGKTFSLKSQNDEFLHENYLLKIGKRSKNISKEVQKPLCKAGNQVYLLILVNFHVAGSGSAFPIRIQIQGSQINADPDPQHQFLPNYLPLFSCSYQVFLIGTKFFATSCDANIGKSQH